jgi:hypothetical protein
MLNEGGGLSRSGAAENEQWTAAVFDRRKLFGIQYEGRGLRPRRGTTEERL